MIAHKFLKENEILFKQGDGADSLFILRKGSVKVYFESEGKEVELAILTAGAVVGEMAFFENEPRSASVKTLETSEFTEITTEDFEKLLNQVPKWLYTLFNSLVKRLRQSNERSQQIEKNSSHCFDPTQKASSVVKILPYQKYPYERTLHALKIILLSIAIDSKKEENLSTLLYDIPLNIWNDFYPEEADFFHKVISITIKTGFIEKKLIKAKQEMLVIHNHQLFVNFINTFSVIAKNLPINCTFISDNSLLLLQNIIEYASKQSHKNKIISLKKLKLEPHNKNKPLENWEEYALELNNLPNIRVIQDNHDISIDLNAENAKELLDYLKFIKLYQDSNLA